MNAQNTNETRLSYIKRLEEPPIAKSLFGDVRWSWLWLILRLYLGYEWLSAGLGKISSSAWTGANAGSALTGFVNNALTETGGAHPAVQGWYASFLQNVVLPNVTTWSYVVALGETLVGIALILGIFTGIAAFFGSFMNMSYLLAGSVSINPILLTIALLLILAWKTAGWWGLDRWVLTSLGTPWRPGLIFHENAGGGQQTAHQPHQA
jgi:thiosulfate dehydrogenase [quinone] large subunit